jgi:hypothetical protein
MKMIRAPWIRCRADESGAQAYEMEWQRVTFAVVAYSEGEARDWWGGLSVPERREQLGLDDNSDQISLI